MHTLTAHHSDVHLSVTAKCNIVYVAAKNWHILYVTQYWSPVRNFHCTAVYIVSCPLDTILRTQKGVLWMVGMTLFEACPSSSAVVLPSSSHCPVSLSCPKHMSLAKVIMLWLPTFKWPECLEKGSVGRCTGRESITAGRVCEGHWCVGLLSGPLVQR